MLFILVRANDFSLIPELIRENKIVLDVNLLNKFDSREASNVISAD